MLHVHCKWSPLRPIVSVAQATQTKLHRWVEIRVLPFCFVLFIFFHQPIKDTTIIPKQKRNIFYFCLLLHSKCMFVATSVQRVKVLFIIANDEHELMRRFLHTRSKFIFGLDKAHSNTLKYCVVHMPKWLELYLSTFQQLNCLLLNKWKCFQLKHFLILWQHAQLHKQHKSLLWQNLIDFGTHPMLDVMVAVDQGCGCSELLLKREVVIWIPTFEDRISEWVSFMFQKNTSVIVHQTKKKSCSINLRRFTSFALVLLV